MFDKNVNGDKFSEWWKSKISINNIFGRHKNSGPPPNRSSYVNLNNASFLGNQMSMNNFVSKTMSETALTQLIPENYFVKLEANNTITHGNSKIINTNSNITTDLRTRVIDKSINYQLNLGVINGNFEISGSSITLGTGFSAASRLYLGSSITLSTDFFRSSNISINGYSDLNGDNKSSGFSAGVKPAALVYKLAQVLYRRFAPIVPWGVEYGAVLPIIGDQNKIY